MARGRTLDSPGKLRRPTNESVVVGDEERTLASTQQSAVQMRARRGERILGEVPQRNGTGRDTLRASPALAARRV